MTDRIQASPVSRPFFSPGAYVLLVLAMVSACYLVARYLFGLEAVTNLDDQNPWGVWIASITSIVALAGGGFTTAAVVFVFNRKRYRPALRPAVLTAWLGYSFAATMLLVELGRYYNIWHPLVYWQGNSVLFEVGICVTFYLTVLTIEFSDVIVEGLRNRVEALGGDRTRRGVRLWLKRVHALLRIIMPPIIILGVVLSCLHQSSLGSLLLIAPYKLSTLWYTPLLPLLFLLSAIAVGLPVVILEAILVAKSFCLQPADGLLTAVARLIPWTLGAYGALKLADFIVRGAYRQLDGSGQSICFIVEVLFGILVPFVLLTLRGLRGSRAALFVSCSMIVFGVVLNRLNVFVVGYQPPYVAVRYFPAVGELMIVVGLIAGFLLVHRVCVIYLPVHGLRPADGIVTPIRDRVVQPSRSPVPAAASMILLALTLALPSAARAAEPTAGNKTFDPRCADDLIVLDSELLNQKADIYEAVQFMHRAHATRARDCTVCHHRMPQNPGDRTGIPLSSLDLARARPVACQQCHVTPLGADNALRPGLKGAFHERCIACHTEQKRGPVDCSGCHRPHVPSHADLVRLPPNPAPQEVTGECIRCHRFQAHEILVSAHWKWHGASPDTLGAEHQIALGKVGIINNYCIDVVSNWPRCTSCHVGYGWKDESFDFRNAKNVDCLVCHDTTGQYKKTPTGAGLPAPEVNLVHVARNVGRPTRRSCGACHFYGGGGDGIKHGDLDSTMIEPPPDHDVHMGRYNMRCQDCHTTTDHRIAGACLAIPAHEGRVACEQCHADKPHIKNPWLDHHLNRHTETVACQTCHIPVFAKSKPTKMYWDWSQAGQDKPQAKDEYGKPTFHKKKGAFVWGMNVQPTYEWYNGKHRRYALGDELDPEQETLLNEPLGHLQDPNAKIHPFKIHRGRQISDAINRHLVVPKLFGGFWKHFDWGRAAEDGMKAAGLPYSGKHDFVDTAMYWAINHEVVPREQALSCTQCHTTPDAVNCTRCHRNVSATTAQDLEKVYQAMTGASRPAANVDFLKLGYKDDPAVAGGRFSKLPASSLRTETNTRPIEAPRDDHVVPSEGDYDAKKHSK